MYKYPYGDSQQLNLDWVLTKLKELEASGGSGGADLEEVSNALISLTYNTSTAYRRYDYAFRNGKLYRCLTDTSGVFNPTAWQEALIGDDLAVLTRWINAIDAAAVVNVKFDTSGTNGKIQQKYHDQYHDVVEVDYTPVQNSKRPLSSNAGYELNGAINRKTPTLFSTGDNTDRLAEIVAQLTNNGYCVLGTGNFYISDTIVMPNNSSLFGSGIATVISLDFSASNKSAIKMAQFNTIEDLKIYGGKPTTATIGNVHGIEWSGDYSTSTNPYTQPRLGKISNVYIDSFSGGGIYCNNTGYEVYTNLNVDNVTIYSCCVGIYIKYWSEYHKFTNVHTWNCFYGCINNGGNNSFVNCDFSGSKEIGFKIENPNNANPNNTHGMCVGCLFNHIKNNTGNAVEISDTHNGYAFVGCQFFYGNISLTNTTGVVFDGCTCGAISITVTGTGVNVFSDDTFHAQPTVNATSATVFDNCYERTNNKAISPFQKTGTLTPAVAGTSAYEVFVKQIGNIVTIRGFIQTIPITANTITSIATLSGIDIPTAGIRTFACYADHAYDPQNICYCEVSTAQGLRVNIPTSGNYAVTFNIVYMLEDSQIT